MSLAAKYILAILSVIFLSLAAVRMVREGGRAASAVRTWLMVGFIFAAVSGWLWFSG
jgi:hypothetical protein